MKQSAVEMFANSGIIINRKDSAPTAAFVPKVPSPRGPSCADGSTFCEDTDNYPR